MQQKLVTKELWNRIVKVGEYGKKNKDGEMMCQACFFDPLGDYKFIAYGAIEDETYGLIFWGYGYLTPDVGWEHGTVGLTQLLEPKLHRLPIHFAEREYGESSGKYTIKELMKTRHCY